MTAPEQSHDPTPAKESSFVVYAWPWLAALKAAVVFTDKGHPNIRINIDSEQDEIIVSALVSNHAVAITVPAHWIDISEANRARDMAFEMSGKMVADYLQVFKTKSFAGVELEDQPLYAVHYDAHRIRYTRADQLDYTELSPLEHLRLSDDELPDNIRDVVDPLNSFPLEGPARLAHVQAQRAVKLQAILQDDLQTLALQPQSEVQLARTAIICGPASSMASIPKPTEKKEEAPPKDGQPQELSFDDEAQDYDVPMFDVEPETPDEPTPETGSDPDRKTGLRVVGAKPPRAV